MEKWIATKQELREKSVVASRGYTSRLKANNVRVPQQEDPVLHGIRQEPLPLL